VNAELRTLPWATEHYCDNVPADEPTTALVIQTRKIGLPSKAQALSTDHVGVSNPPDACRGRLLMTLRYTDDRKELVKMARAKRMTDVEILKA